MKTLCIVPCGKRKIWDKKPELGPVKAKEAYIGVFTKKCMEYAEKFYPNSWCILSAKHGFLFPEDIVPGPYDVTFNNPKTNPISIDELKRQAKEKALEKYEVIVVLGGKKYVNIIKEVFSNKEVKSPLSGKGGIGKMMKILKEAVTKGKTL